MKTLKTLALATAVSAGLLGSVGAMAATDAPNPTPTSSTGNFEIDLTILELARVWGLDDFPLTYNSSDNTIASVEKDFCIFSNKNFTSNEFTLTVSSLNGNGNGNTAKSFTLIDEAASTQGSDTASIPYKITIAENKDEGKSVSTASGKNDQEFTLNAGALSDQKNPWTDSCSVGTGNMTLKVEVTGNIIFPEGIYSDNVTLQVEPN